MKAIRFLIFLSLLGLVHCQAIRPPSIMLWLFNLFSITPTYGEIQLESETNLFTSEAGREAKINIVLSKEPTSDVQIGPIAISDPSEGVLKSAGTLTFTTSNWNVTQVVSIGGVDDTLSDGNIEYQVFFGEFITEDPAYRNRATQSVLIVNTDDETSGVAASPLTSLLTTEAGSSTTISYVLQTKPYRNVTIKSFESSVPSEAVPEEATLVFTPENWDKPQTISVSGVRDFVIDGSKSYQIKAGLTASEDPAYASRSVPVVSGTNGDSDSAGFTVAAVGGTTTTEAGGQVQFKVVLNSKPSANVNVASLVPSDFAEIAVTPNNLTFTSSNWNTAQIVTVTGVDDFVADGNTSLTLSTSNATSTDTNYNNIAGPVFPTITNQDNDTRGFAISPTSNATFSENGGSQVFQFRLTSQPPAGKAVRITGISTSNTALVSVNISDLTFDSTNWNVDQPVTATSIDNQIDEDTRTITFTFGAIDQTLANRDPGYDSITLPSSVSFFVTDDDTAGVTRTPETGFLVDENAGPLTETFTVRLNSQPTSNVIISSIASSNTNEITVSPSSLTFTSANWNVAQVVTLSSVVDGTLDGNKQVTISYSNITSTDSKYSGMAISSSIATNQDSGSTSILLINATPSSFQVTEGNTFTFQIRLGILPGSTVTIGPITSSDTTEFEILDASNNATTSRTLNFTATAGGSVNFTGSNSTSSFNVAQTITVRAVNDAFDDGDLPVNIQIPVATGSFYAGLRPTADDAAGFTTYNPSTGNIVVTNIDNDTKGFTYSTASLTFTEGGAASQTFTVRLNSAPCTTPSNLSNCAGGDATLNLNVPAAPTGLTQYTVSPSALTFTSANWNTPQTVTVTIANDDIDQTTQAVYTITTNQIVSSTDYGGQTPSATVSVTLIDNDNPAANARILFAVSTATGSGSFTIENGTETIYSLSLASQPYPGNTVTVTIATLDPTEGRILDASNNPVDSRDFTFTSLNWNTIQQVRIRGSSDDGDVENTSYSVTSTTSSSAEVGSKPSGYSPFDSLTGPTASLVNFKVLSNPVSLILPGQSSPLSGSVTYAETQSAVSVFVVLAQAPTADVVIPVSKSTSFPCRLLTSPSNVDQFALNVGSSSNVVTGNITITSANWNSTGTFNRIQFDPVDDPVDDGNVSCPLVLGTITSADPFYSSVDPDDLDIIVTDNDTAGITFSSVLPTSFITSLSGARSSLSLRPTTQPTANVTISFSLSQAYGTLSVSSYTFTPSNYSTAQPLTIIGINTGTTGDQTYNLSYTVSSSETTTGFGGSNVYNGLTVTDRSISHIQNLFDIVPCSSATPVAPTACGTPLGTGGLVSASLLTTEAGGQARFQIRLRARPTNDVTLAVASSNTSEGTVSPATLTFTNANWNTWQDVVVTGVDDTATPTADGNISYQINLGPMVSTDAGFSGQTLPPVPISNTDNETAGITVSTISRNTTEAGQTATFTIVLTARPGQDVTIGLSSDNTSEGTVSPSSVTFTTVNWNTVRTITVTGVNDGASDGTVAYSIITAPAVSSSGPYNGFNPADVSVNNDGLSVIVSAISGNTTEAGGTATFTIVLGVQPDASVTIPISSSDTNEGTVTPASITFSTANWNVPRTITVTGVNDGIPSSGNQNYSIITGSIASAGVYNGINPPDVNVTNIE